MFARHRRVVIIVGAVVVIGGVGFALLTWRLFHEPALDDLQPADAIVMLAGGGPRKEYTAELVEEGLADTVVYAAEWTGEVWSSRPCNLGEYSFTVTVRILCFDPDPPTTQGEVRYISDLARQEGWDEIIVVASTDQATRARLLLDRCFDGTSYVAAVDHHQRFAVRAVYEWVAMVKAQLSRAC